MKKLVCGLLIFVLMAGGSLGCAKKETVPARGVWDGRTYTNTEVGIKLTAPEGYDILTDKQIVTLFQYSEDYYNDVKNTQGYVDLLITDQTSRVYIAYVVCPLKGLSPEQYINHIKVNVTTLTVGGEQKNIIYGETYTTVLCGKNFVCCNYTLEGTDGYYGTYCYGLVSDNVFTQINYLGQNAEKLTDYLSFFDMASVNLK